MKGPILEARGLELSLGDESEKPFFSGLDFALSEGELLVLAGRNGSGKTLLCRLLSGLLEPQKGQVLFRGEDIRSLSGSPALRTGYVFEDARLETLGETVEEDLRFGPANAGFDAEESGRRARSAALRVGLEGKMRRSVHELSGGELRRLAIADVLCLDPPVLILDEPFANLDLAGVQSVLKVILELKGAGRSLIVATHEIEKILGAADSFAVMDAGRLALRGRPEEVLKKGIEAYGLRDPMRAPSGIGELLWI